MRKDKFVGIKEIAKQVNVAIAAVDRVINGRKGVIEKTKEKVLKIIKQIEFQSNIMANNLAKNKTFVIGVLLPKDSKHSTYWEYPLKGIMKAQKALKQYSIKAKTFLFNPGNYLDNRKQILNVNLRVLKSNRFLGDLKKMSEILFLIFIKDT